MKAYEALRLIQTLPVELRAQLGDIDDIFTYLMPEWSLNDWLDHYEEALKSSEHYSGWRYYPVRAPIDQGAAMPARHNPMWARRNLPLWEGEYGDSRQRLLDHLAAFFEMVDK